MALGFRIPPAVHADLPALDLLASILGRGQVSRLTRALRFDSELVTSVHAYLHLLREPGLMVVASTLRSGDVAGAGARLLSEVFRLRSERVSSAELDAAKQAIEAENVFAAETVQGQAQRLGHAHAISGGDPHYARDYLRRIDEVRAEDLVAVASRYLNPSGLTWAFTGPGTMSKKWRSRLLAVVGKAATGASPTPATKRVSNVERKVVQLPSCVRLVVQRDPQVPVVAARLVWSGGLRNESSKSNGINHLLASTITSGCGQLDTEALRREVARRAGALSGFSGRNSFGMRSEWLRKDWRDGLGLMLGCVLNPHFEQEPFDIERRRLAAAIGSRKESPSRLAFGAFLQALYRKHPYRMDVIGDEDVIAGLTTAKVKRFYNRHYPVSEMTLAVVGDVDPAEVIEWAEGQLGAIKKRAAAKLAVENDVFSGRSQASRQVFRFLDRQQAHLVLGFPGVTIDSPDRHALEVLTALLGGQGGRLFVELRERRGLAYQVGAFSLEGVDPGYVAVHLACSPDKLEAALEAVHGEIEKVVTGALTEAEVKRAVDHIVGTHHITLQRRGAVAAALAFYESYALGVDEFDAYPKKLRAVRVADVRRVALEYLDWDKAITSTVMPPALSPNAKKRAKGAYRKVRRRR
jgi:zinc protease